MAVSRAAERIRVYLLEEDPLRLIGLQSLLGENSEFELHSGGVERILHDRGQPVVLLDARNHERMMAIMGTLKQARPDVRILLTGSGNRDEDILQAVSAGAKGYVHESASPDEFQQAIQEIGSGSVWIPRRILSLFIERVTASAHTARTGPVFTPRELDVLRLIVDGRSNAEIASELGIEPRTVKQHVSSLMKKAKVRSRTALSVHVITHSWLSRKT